MLRFFPNEEWKEFKLDHKTKFRYAVSNYGRVISYSDTFENGTLLKCATIDGYKVFRYKITVDNKLVNRQFFVRKLVAEQFLQKTSDDQQFVLLLDRNRNNNFVANLKWATKKEMLEHNKQSPMVIEAHKKMIERKKQFGKGNKLTSSVVKIIKKKILAPDRKTRMKILARQFGISEMQLYRIKSGENWGHVTID